MSLTLQITGAAGVVPTFLIGKLSEIDTSFEDCAHFKRAHCAAEERDRAVQELSQVRMYQEETVAKLKRSEEESRGHEARVEWYQKRVWDLEMDLQVRDIEIRELRRISELLTSKMNEPKFTPGTPPQTSSSDSSLCSRSAH